ncbi:MAG TPA: phage tail sheath subtilisin-like domain-containing protein [Vicinamibacterales bacterium]
MTYPGVYIEEVPSGVRTITGVATSIAAFAGWAPRGPVDRAQRVLSFQDFVRHFGGLDRRSLLGYIVEQFFGNGGRDAYIIRLVADNAATAEVTIDGLKITASSPGAWANDYKVETHRRSDEDTRFRLSVIYEPTGNPAVTVETFEDLSITETDRRFVGNVVNAGSSYVRVELVGAPSSPPVDTPPTAFSTAGSDGDVLLPDTPAFEAKLLPVSADGGIYHLDRVDLFNLLCVPGETTGSEVRKLQKYCRDKRAFCIIDSLQGATLATMQSGPDLAIVGPDALNSAVYYPWVKAADPLQENRLRVFPPCGFIAGIIARTDATRGPWKAPAGSEAGLAGAMGLELALTDLENGTLNPRGINCIRAKPVFGTVVWGSRTLDGADERASEWKYIPVRRLALYIEESAFRGTQWVTFEPNDEPLWAQIRLNLGAFMQNLFRQGAFAGRTPREAYFVKCDAETTTQNDVNLGVVNILLGFAPLKPAEFVVIKIQQMSGQVQT